MNNDVLKKSVDFVRQRWPAAKPRAGLILGSGWDTAGDFLQCRATLAYADIPGLGSPTVLGHSGLLHWCEASGVETFLFQGRRHYYEGEGWTPVALPVHLLKQFGAEVLVLTNAAGGMREDLEAGDLMVLTDHLNLMHGNPLIGPHDPAWGPRFPDLSQVYCPRLRKRLEQIFQTMDVPYHCGIYAAVTGPTFETPAEVRAYRNMGADAIGMSTVPEAVLAYAAGLRVAALSCIANLAAGLRPQPITHDEVIQTSREILPHLRGVLEAFWKELPHELGPTNPTA